MDKIPVPYISFPEADFQGAIETFSNPLNPPEHYTISDGLVVAHLADCHPILGLETIDGIPILTPSPAPFSGFIIDSGSNKFIITPPARYRTGHTIFPNPGEVIAISSKVAQSLTEYYPYTSVPIDEIRSGHHYAGNQTAKYEISKISNNHQVLFRMFGGKYDSQNNPWGFNHTSQRTIKDGVFTQEELWESNPKTDLTIPFGITDHQYIFMGDYDAFLSSSVELYLGRNNFFNFPMSEYSGEFSLDLRENFGFSAEHISRNDLTIVINRPDGKIIQKLSGDIGFFVNFFCPGHTQETRIKDFRRIFEIDQRRYELAIKQLDRVGINVSNIPGYAKFFPTLRNGDEYYTYSMYSPYVYSLAVESSDPMHSINSIKGLQDSRHLKGKRHIKKEIWFERK